MTTELVLLATAGAPTPVAGRAGISSALIVDERIFVIDCGRDGPFKLFSFEAKVGVGRIDYVRIGTERRDNRVATSDT